MTWHEKCGFSSRQFPPVLSIKSTEPMRYTAVKEGGDATARYELGLCPPHLRISRSASYVVTFLGAGTSAAYYGAYEIHNKPSAESCFYLTRGSYRASL